MDWRSEWKALLTIIAVFLGCYYLPLESTRFNNSLVEALQLLRWYAREHVLLCLVPVAWFGLELWKAASVIIPVSILAIPFSGSPMVPFATAVLGLSIVTSTQGCPTCS
jgi:hypothetical protein